MPSTRSFIQINNPTHPISQVKIERDSNIELLRIVLMCMIITHHLVLHGTELSAMYTNTLPINISSFIKILLNSFVVFGVNTFVFISGYYGIKFKFTTLIALLLQAAFYSVIIDFTYNIFIIKNITPRLVLSFFPFSRCLWWFFTVYLALYIFSPILNKSVNSFTKKQLGFLVCAFLIINCFSGYFFNGRGVYVMNGYSIFSFITIYITARYLRRFYNERKSYIPYLIFYTVLSLIVFLMVSLLVYKDYQLIAGKLFYYNNPILVLSSISFFYIFKNIKIKNSFINSVSPYVFGVYLIHDHEVIRNLLIQRVGMFSNKYSNDLLLLYSTLFVIMAVVFIVCICIEKIRTIIFKPILNYVNQLPLIKGLEVHFEEN